MPRYGVTPTELPWQDATSAPNCPRCGYPAAPQRVEGIGAIAWPLIIVALLLAFVAGTCMPRKAQASPVYLTLDTGLTAFKWGANQTGLGFPHFESPKWDVEPGIEWAPTFLEKRGLWFRASFPWQALGHSATFYHQGQTYIDGPRIGIRFRGRVIQ